MPLSDSPWIVTHKDPASSQHKTPAPFWHKSAAPFWDTLSFRLFSSHSLAFLDRTTPDTLSSSTETRYPATQIPTEAQLPPHIFPLPNMGGKVWSDVEEEIFWTVLARMAPPGFHKESKAKKKSHHELAKSWAPLIGVMKMHMMRKHPMWTQDDLPRRYSAISICEF